MVGRVALAAVAALAGVGLLAAATAPEVNRVHVGKVNGITVDGAIDDWKDVPVQYFEEGPRITAIVHDDHFLYVHFRFSDLDLARRVLRTGAIVWINGSDEHEPSFGLRYRGSEKVQKALAELQGSGEEAPPGSLSDAPPGAGPYRRDSPGGPPPGTGPRFDRPQLGTLELLRLGVVDEVFTSGATPDGPAAACGMTDGVFAYEFRVPLAELSSVPQLTGTPLPSRIAIGFQMSGVTRADMDAMRDRMRSSGGRPGGGRRGGSGGGPGGMGRGRMPGGSPPRDAERRARGNEIVWVDVEFNDLPASPASTR